MPDTSNPSAVSVTIAGAGGAGLNLSRPFLTDKRLMKALFFDTSMTNTRHNENCILLGSGDGSGSHRAENARSIEQQIPQHSDEELGVADVVIVKFSLAGGSGSVCGPLLIREYVKRGAKVIAVCVADTSYSVAATNTLNTLKTLTQICKNNNIYLPMILLSNDMATSRGPVDEAERALVGDLLDLLTSPVYEIDRNDRLNWVNPTKVVNAQPGLKLLGIVAEKKLAQPKVVLGTESSEMVDSLLILQSSPDEEVGDKKLSPSRLKKMGFYYEKSPRLVGRVTSDISSVEGVINQVEHMGHQDRSQKHLSVDRLVVGGDSDLIL